MAFSKEQHEFRRKYIGASQSGGIMGLDPRNPPIKIYNYMVHGERDEGDSIAAKRGTYMEPFIAAQFEQEYKELGVKLVDPKAIWPDTYGAIVDPEITWLSASLDRYIEGTNEPVEIKDIAGDFEIMSEFGAEGSETVPLKYHVQVMHQLKVWRTYCDYNKMTIPSRGYLYAMLRGSQLRAFPIDWDEAKWREIYTVLSWFMQNHIVPQVPPPITGDEHYKKFLQERRAAMGVRDEKREDNSPEIVALAAEMRILKNIEKAVEERYSLLKNQAMEMIGSDKGVTGEYGSLQIVSGSPKEKVDLEKAVLGFLDVVPKDKYDEIIRECTYTITSKQSHVQLYPKKGWNPDIALVEQVQRKLLESK